MSEVHVGDRWPGVRREPDRQVEEFWAVVGRRGGKTRAMATLSCLNISRFMRTPPASCPANGASWRCWVSAGSKLALRSLISQQSSPREPLSKLKISELLNNISLSKAFDILTMPAFLSLDPRRDGAWRCSADEIAFWFSEERKPESRQVKSSTPSVPLWSTTSGPLICHQLAPCNGKASFGKPTAAITGRPATWRSWWPKVRPVSSTRALSPRVVGQSIPIVTRSAPPPNTARCSEATWGVPGA